MRANLFSMTLQEERMLTPKVKHFSFLINTPTPFHYLPGQFITIQFEQGSKTLKRSYSIANSPLQNNLIEFAAGYVAGGPGTDLLFNLKPGDKVEASGPFGRLILKEQAPKRYILVATSTGVTPYRAMITALTQHLKENPQSAVVILQGVQTREDILYLEDFLSFANMHAQVSFRTHLSRERSPLKDYEFNGYVQHSFPDLNLNPQEDCVYLCGNPNMVDEAFADLKERGFSLQQIIREKYFSAPKSLV